MLLPEPYKDRVERLDVKPIPVPIVKNPEAWFEVDLDAHWRAAYRVLQQAGRPVIGEVRVFPIEQDNEGRQPGEWSGAFVGLHAQVPAGGITARLLRRVRLGDASGSHFVDGLKEWERFLEHVPGAKRFFTSQGFRSTRPTRRRGGRRGWSLDDLLAASVFYVEIGKSSPHPVAELAKQWKLKRTQARDLLQTARLKGLLTGGRQGRTSRTLTDHAKQLLLERTTKTASPRGTR
jgi:hypothetical protein